MGSRPPGSMPCATGFDPFRLSFPGDLPRNGSLIEPPSRLEGRRRRVDSLSSIEPPDANVDWFFSGRISIVFFFNRQGQCVGYWIDSFTYELTAKSGRNRTRTWENHQSPKSRQNRRKSNSRGFALRRSLAIR